MATHQRYEAAAFERSRAKRAVMPLDDLQFLILGIADRENQAATLAQLGEEGWRYGGRGRSDQDGIKRRKVLQTERAISTMDMDVTVA